MLIQIQSNKNQPFLGLKATNKSCYMITNKEKHVTSSVFVHLFKESMLMSKTVGEQSMEIIFI